MLLTKSGIFTGFIFLLSLTAADNARAQSGAAQSYRARVVLVTQELASRLNRSIPASSTLLPPCLRIRVGEIIVHGELLGSISRPFKVEGDEETLRPFLGREVLLVGNAAAVDGPSWVQGLFLLKSVSPIDELPSNPSKAMVAPPGTAMIKEVFVQAFPTNATSPELHYLCVERTEEGLTFWHSLGDTDLGAHALGMAARVEGVWVIPENPLPGLRCGAVYIRNVTPLPPSFDKAKELAAPTGPNLDRAFDDAVATASSSDGLD